MAWRTFQRWSFLRLKRVSSTLGTTWLIMLVIVFCLHCSLHRADPSDACISRPCRMLARGLQTPLPWSAFFCFRSSKCRHSVCVAIPFSVAGPDHFGYCICPLKRRLTSVVASSCAPSSYRLACCLACLKPARLLQGCTGCSLPCLVTCTQILKHTKGFHVLFLWLKETASC